MYRSHVRLIHTVRIRPLLILLSLPAFAGTIVSTFDTSFEGWAVAGDGPATSVTYLSSGGNPGGAIQRVDTSLLAYMHFQAPAKFLGDLSAYYDGTLSYDLIQTVPDTDTAWYYRELLQGGGLLILHTVGLPPETANWRHFSVPLNAAAGWIVVPTIEDYTGTPVTDAVFQSLLANVTALYITGDLISGNDMSTLDNVVLQPVPEPSTGLLTGSAFGALLIAASRLRRA